MCATITICCRIFLLSALILIVFENGKDICKYLADLQTNYKKLDEVQLPVSKALQIVILPVSVINDNWRLETFPALRTMEAGKATSEMKVSRKIEEQHL